MSRKPKADPPTIKMSQDTQPENSLLPVCPDWLGSHGKSKWRELLPQLAEDGTGKFKKIDGEALAQYCDAFDTFIKCKEELAKLESHWCSGPNGALYPHPAVGDRNKAKLAMKTWGDVLEINKNRRKSTKATTQTPVKRKPA